MPQATAHLSPGAVAIGAARFFGYLVACLAASAIVGLVATVGLLAIALMRIEGRERWSLVLPYAGVLVVAIHLVFGRLMALAWPPSLIGRLLASL
jgi:hypothetical protein